VKKTEYEYADKGMSGAKVVKSSPHNHTEAPPNFCDGGMRNGGKVGCYADGGAVNETGAGSASPGSGGRLTTADVTEKPTFMGAVKDRISSMLPDVSGHSESTPAAGSLGTQRTAATLKEADRQSE